MFVCCYKVSDKKFIHKTGQTAYHMNKIEIPKKKKKRNAISLEASFKLKPTQHLQKKVKNVVNFALPSNQFALNIVHQTTMETVDTFQ